MLIAYVNGRNQKKKRKRNNKKENKKKENINREENTKLSSRNEFEYTDKKISEHFRSEFHPWDSEE